MSKINVNLDELCDAYAINLETALSGRKPFRAFKDVLYDFPEERKQWFEFEREAHRRQV